MKIKVLGRYQNEPRNINVYPGDEIEVDDRLVEFLQHDAPGCFEIPGQPPRDPDQKPFDLPPDGTTVKTDATPSVITGPDSGVTVTHTADADEQSEIESERQKAALTEEEKLAEEQEAERKKALWAPPADKQVKGAPKSK
jgi:hypothetical protein